MSGGGNTWEPVIRSARPDDLLVLLDIEVSAGACFRQIDMSEIAQDDPGSVQRLARYQAVGHALVAVDHWDLPVAYLLLDLLDYVFHIEQVSVRAEYARQGIGRALIEEAAQLAASRQMPAITLTTFRDVPWNAPYYLRIGFQPLTDSQLTPGLRRVRQEEGQRGLDRWPRVAMRRVAPRSARR